MTDRTRLVALILVMALVAVVTSGLSMWMLYKTALGEQRARLVDLVESEARLIEAITLYAADEHGGDVMEAVNQAMAAVRKNHGTGGGSGDFVIARRVGDEILFLFSNRILESGVQESVPIDGDLAEPMRRALTGQSGTIIAPDYGGATVMAAYESLAGLELGLVAKFDMAEIRAPFIRAGTSSGAVALVVVLLGAFAIRRLNNPLIERLETAVASLDNAQRIAGFGHFDWDLFTNEIRCSDEMYHILGIEPVAPRDSYKAFIDAIHPVDRPGVLGAIEKSIGGEGHYEVKHRIMHPDGVVRHAQAQGEVKLGLNGSPARITGTVQDVTERRLAEHAANRLGRILDRSRNEIYTFDAETLRFVEANEGARRNLGYSMEELKKLTPVDIKPTITPEQFSGLVKPLERGETESLAFETVHQRRDGSTYPVEIHLQLSHAEVPPVYVAIVVDITERKQAEKKLKAYADELERSNRELEEFAYVASHDLQEPLRKVSAFGDRLKRKYADVLGDEGLDYLDRMQNASQRMSVLISDLLTFSRVTTKAKPFAPVDLAQVAHEVISDLEVRIEETGARVEVNDLPCIDADPGQMRQLLQNLIGNALKFQCEGEQPIVVVRGELLNGATGSMFSTRRPNGACRITVSDNGIGFEPKYANRIFTIFQRLHGRNEYQGTGIGLAICRKIVERHGGSIEATSAPGEGATFQMTLPVAQAQGSTDA